MKEIMHGELGVIGEYDLELKEGKIVGQVSLDIARVLEGAAKRIPGPYDDALFQVLVAAIKAI